MLFRTVYGPELPALYHFVLNRGAVSITDLRRWFVQTNVISTESTNLDEAMAFLTACDLLEPSAEVPETLVPVPVIDFRLGLLQRLQQVQSETSPGRHPLDPWFMGVLDKCFIRRNVTYIANLHREANSLELPVPCSEEKINAWRRVMEFLGCGWRVHTGFTACYATDLVRCLLLGWEREGPLEEWLRHAETYLPVHTETAELSMAMALPLLELESSGLIRLTTRGDFAGRAYMGRRRVKWMLVEG